MTATLITSTNQYWYGVGNRAVFDVSGTPYVVLRNYGDYISVFKKTNGSFSEQDSSNRPSETGMKHMDARLDGTTIKIAYGLYVTGVNWLVRYVEFDTSSDTWGSPETAVSHAYEEYPSANYDTCRLDIDSSGYAHIAYGRIYTHHGTNYRHIYHVWETSGGWQTPERITPTDANNYQIKSVAMDSSDRFITIYDDVSGGDLVHRSRSSAGTWDTENIVSSNPSTNSYCSIALDSSDVRKVALEDYSHYLDIRSGTSGANPTWSDDGSDEDTGVYYPSIGIYGTNRYVVYEDSVASPYAISLAKRENGSYSVESAIEQDSTYEFAYPIIEHPVRSTGFHYIWIKWTDDDWYWNEYSFAGGVTPQAVGGGTVSISGDLSKELTLHKSVGAGSVTPAGDVSIRRLLTHIGVGSGSVPITGLLSKKTFKAVGSGVINPFGILSTTKKILQSVGGGTVTPVGVLSFWTKFFQSVGNGVVTSSGTLTFWKRVFQAVGGGTVTPTGTLSLWKKSFQSVGNGVISVAGTLTSWKKAFQSVGEGIVTSSGELSTSKKSFLNVGSGVVSILGVLDKHRKTSLTVGQGVVSIVGSLIATPSVPPTGILKHIGVLTDGAFPNVPNSDVTARIPVLTDGAFLPFFIIAPEPEIIVFGVTDKGYTKISDFPFIIAQDYELEKHSSKSTTRITDVEREIIGSTEKSDVDSKNVERIVDTDVTDISDTNIEE